MSQENVDAMRKVYEAMARGDFWAAREVLDTEIEWSWPSSTLTSGAARLSPPAPWPIRRRNLP